MPDTLTPRTIAGQRLVLLLSECDIRWPDEYTRIATEAFADLIAKAENERIDALTAATVAAINDHADIRLPDRRLAIARDHAVEVIRGVLEPQDA